MRTAPVALPHLGDDEAIARNGRAVSLLTHDDPLAAEACVLWCVAIDRAIRERRLNGVWDGLALKELHPHLTREPARSMGRLIDVMPRRRTMPRRAARRDAAPPGPNRYRHGPGTGARAMARSWLSMRVELVSGRGEYFWPRPGRVIVARRTATFRELAATINVAFGRWDFSHLHRFVLDDVELVTLDHWDESPRGAADDSSRLSILELGQQFAYEFDMGDGWEHLCTVAPHRVDPYAELGFEPTRPTVSFGWGDLPDQYGRRFDGDDDGPLPDQPEPPTSDLPPLLPHWGDWTPPQPDEQFDWLPSRQGWDDASWRTLLGAVNREDGKVVVAVLRPRDPLGVAHLAGQGLVIALRQQVADSWVLARRLAADLRDRMGPGDDELADDLDAARGVIDTGLRPVPIDLEELAMHLEGDDLGMGGWNIDLQSGRWWPDDPVGTIGEQPPDDWDDPDRWLEVTSIGSRDGWEDMRRFIESLENDDLAQRLDRAIRGSGAFRRFRDELHQHDELRRAWFRFSDDRQRGRARAWLAMHGVRPVAKSSPSPPTGDDAG